MLRLTLKHKTGEQINPVNGLEPWEQSDKCKNTTIAATTITTTKVFCFTAGLDRAYSKEFLQFHNVRPFPFPVLSLPRLPFLPLLPLEEGSLNQVRGPGGTLWSIFKILSPLDSAQYLLQNDHYIIPHHLKDVAALPRETIMFNKSYKFFDSQCISLAIQIRERHRKNIEQETPWIEKPVAYICTLLSQKATRLNRPTKKTTMLV